MPQSSTVPRFAYLGPVSSHLGDASTTPPAKQQRTLLARLLAAAGEPVPVADLQATLWGATPPASADKAIQVLVGRLRGATGGAEPARVIRHEVDAYCLDPATCSIDAREFEQHLRRGRLEASLGRHEPAIRSLDAALALWRGPAFEEYADRHWAQRERARLDTSRAAAGIQRAESLLHVGEAAAALDQLDAAIADWPGRDRLHALRLWAIAVLRSPAAAQAEFERLRALLSERAGMEPGPQLLAAAARVRAGTRPVVPSDDAPSPPPAHDPAPGRSCLSETARELAAWLDARGEQQVDELLRAITTSDRDEVDVLDDLEALLEAGILIRRIAPGGTVRVAARPGRDA